METDSSSKALNTKRYCGVCTCYSSHLSALTCALKCACFLTLSVWRCYESKFTGILIAATIPCIILRAYLSCSPLLTLLFFRLSFSLPLRLGVTRAGDLVNVSLQQLTSCGVKKLHARRLKSDPVVFLDAQQVRALAFGIGAKLREGALVIMADTFVYGIELNDCDSFP